MGDFVIFTKPLNFITLFKLVALALLLGMGPPSLCFAENREGEYAAAKEKTQLELLDRVRHGKKITSSDQAQIRAENFSGMKSKILAEDKAIKDDLRGKLKKIIFEILSKDAIGVKPEQAVSKKPVAVENKSDRSATDPKTKTLAKPNATQPVSQEPIKIGGAEKIEFNRYPASTDRAILQKKSGGFSVEPTAPDAKSSPAAPASVIQSGSASELKFDSEK